MNGAKFQAVFAGLAVAFLATACHTSSSAEQHPSASACTELGGTVGPDDFCEVHEATAQYTLTFRFPTGFADQQSVTDELKRRRTDFVDWVTSSTAPPPTHPYELDVSGKAYHSGNRQHGTQSLVLTIGSDTGVHPVTTFKAFNYSLTNHAPFGFDGLFKPGSDPVPILNPIVRQEILRRDPTDSPAANALTTTAYQQFAVTDDEIVFFFNQDGVMPHANGPLEVAIPRSALASILA